MHLTFKNDALKVLLADAQAKWPNGTRASYGQEDNPPKGFWIVGDEGVYLMHNGRGAEGSEDTKAVVAYAAECNPKAMEFDDWWANKRATFGGDDGVDFIEPDFILDCIAKGRDLHVHFTADSMEFHYGIISDPEKRVKVKP